MAFRVLHIDQNGSSIGHVTEPTLVWGDSRASSATSAVAVVFLIIPRGLAHVDIEVFDVEGGIDVTGDHTI